MYELQKRAPRVVPPLPSGWTRPALGRFPEPDPAGHADALIHACGIESASEIARLYAQGFSSDCYWPRVLAALTRAREWRQGQDLGNRSHS